MVTGSVPHLLFESQFGHHLYLSQDSQLYDVEETGDVLNLLPIASAMDRPGRVDAPPPQHLSLNVSASCNLACGYCYAGQGGFQGSQPAAMDFITARLAVDRLLAGVDRSRPATIGFIGGEPFVNRRLIRRVVDYASGAACRAGADLRFSVTTNGTLLNDSDCELLRRHRFAVTVSIDGSAEVHDAQRPRRGLRHLA